MRFFQKDDLLRGVYTLRSPSGLEVVSKGDHGRVSSSTAQGLPLTLIGYGSSSKRGFRRTNNVARPTFCNSYDGVHGRPTDPVRGTTDTDPRPVTPGFFSGPRSRRTGDSRGRRIFVRAERGSYLTDSRGGRGVSPAPCSVCPLFSLSESTPSDLLFLVILTEINITRVQTLKQ